MDVRGVDRELYRDRRNTARETRARFAYQDECVALRIVRNLTEGDIESVVLEWSTDYALRTSRGEVEIVSVKHVEPSQGPWTLGRLKAASVLIDLHRVWREMEEVGDYVFESNAGVAPDLAKLFSSDDVNPGNPLVAHVAKHLNAGTEEAARFLNVLTISPVLPRRNEISDVAIQEMRAVLRRLQRDENLAEVKYGEIVGEVAAASTDVPPTPSERLSRLGGLARTAFARQQESNDAHQILLMRDLRRIVESSDTCHIYGIDSNRLLDLQSDPLFTGRADHLAQLSVLLRPGDETEVPPVVIHGLTGNGKTSLAMEWAAQNSGAIESTIISASSRNSILTGVANLTGADVPGVLVTDHALDQNDPHKLPALPSSPHLLLILDGLVNPGDLDGVVARRSRTRVIVTTTLTHVDDAYADIPLGPWTEQEALAYVQRILRSGPGDRARELVEALGSHPMAVSQAVHYCRTQHLSISDYLVRLNRHPGRTLEVGSVIRNREPASRAIELALLAVVRQSSDALSILRILSFASAYPVPEWMFEADVSLPLLDVPTQIGPSSRVRSRLDRTWRRGWKIFDRLADPVNRDVAIACLHRYSLVVRESGYLSVHPLVQRLVHDAIPKRDIKTWLRVSMGLFAQLTPDLAGSSSGHSGDDSLDLLPHMISVIDHALNAGYSPPVATVTLANASGLHIDLGDPSSGNQFAERAVEISMRQGDVQLTQYTLARLSRARQALSRTDDTLDTIAQREGLARTSRDHTRLYFALRDRLMVTLGASRFDDAEAAERELIQYLGNAKISAQMAVEVGLCRARLAWARQRAGEAQVHIDAATEAARHAELSSYYIEELSDTAALIASAQGDSAAARRHSRAAFERAKRTSPAPNLRLASRAVAYCSFLLDEGNTSDTHDLLETALQQVLDLTGTGSAEHGIVLAQLGRCLFLKGNDQRKAQDTLEYAESILRRHGGTTKQALASTNVHLAQIFSSLGQYSEARDCIRRSIGIDTEMFGERSIEVGKDLLISVKIEASARRYIDADRVLNRCLEIFRVSPAQAGSWLSHAIDLEQELARLQAP